ncbi:MAG: nitroreductase family deazaflavin-dependent oxidoreductase [Dehalococcoidia bacterium]
MDLRPDEAYCYLTTTGRKSGEPREIEIWYGVIDSKLYMLSGSGEDEHGPKAHWVRNLLKTPEVTVRVRDETRPGAARVVERGSPEDAAARKLLVERYQPGYSNNLENWGRTSVVVEVAFGPAN